ncbi:MAG: hypothetical protein ACYC2H_12110 [Thermoplasmatota archaeon]
MATARADPLRSTLDNLLQLDPRSEADRPYLVAMLRRLGYTEREIEEVVRSGKLPAAAPVEDSLAPAREYRLVVPSGDSRFALDNTAGSATDAPFEDLERVEFEDPSNDLVFENVGEGQELEWQDAQDQDAKGAPDERVGEDLQWEDTQAQEGTGGEGAEELQQSPQPGEPGFEEGSIDTFGNPDAVTAPNRTRVRVRRIRASSKEEAERKVSGGGRNVIKSVPVDIVERWGPGGDKAKAPKKDDKEA